MRSDCSLVVLVDLLTITISAFCAQDKWQTRQYFFFKVALPRLRFITLFNSQKLRQYKLYQNTTYIILYYIISNYYYYIDRDVSDILIGQIIKKLQLFVSVKAICRVIFTVLIFGFIHLWSRVKFDKNSSIIYIEMVLHTCHLFWASCTYVFYNNVSYWYLSSPIVSYQPCLSYTNLKSFIQLVIRLTIDINISLTLRCTLTTAAIWKAYSIHEVRPFTPVSDALYI